eukprot:RCo034614
MADRLDSPVEGVIQDHRPEDSGPGAAPDGAPCPCPRSHPLSLALQFSVITIAGEALRIQPNLSELKYVVVTPAGIPHPPERGSLSKPASVSLDTESREKAKIPLSACTYAFAYPVLRDRPQMGDLSPQVFSFLLFGGFVYFGTDGKVVQINTLGSGTDLVFDGPYALAAMDTLQFQPEAQPATLQRLITQGVVSWRWAGAGTP